MKKSRKIIWMIVWMVLILGTIQGCKKKADDETSEALGSTSVDETTISPPATAELPEKTTEGDENSVTPTKQAEDFKTLPLRTYRHKTLPFEILLPDAALIRETEDEIVAETDDLFLYVFGMDTYNCGAVYNEMDLVSLIDLSDRFEVAKDMLRLNAFEISSDADTMLYNDINGLRGFYCTMSNMECDRSAEDIVSGSGLAMIYGKKSDVGVYVVLGISKKAQDAENATTIQNTLRECALSLKQDSNSEEVYVVSENTMSDGTKSCIAYKNGSIAQTDNGEAGLYLYYNDDKDGFFLIRHYSMLGNVSTQDQLQSVIEEFEDEEGVTISDPETFRGKMEYQSVTITYPENGKEMQEVICITANENGSIWLVDLYGTTEVVKTQQENLSILLWSLQEE